MRRTRRAAATAVLALGQGVGIIGGIIFTVGLVCSIVPLAVGEWVADKILDPEDDAEEEVDRGFDS